MTDRWLKFGARIWLMACMMAAFSAASVAAAEYVSVVKDGVNLRSGPSTKDQVIYQLPKGYPLKVLARKGKWIKVVDFENDKGWIYGPLVDATPHVIVKVKECNLRKGPGTNFDIVGKLSREVILEKIGKKGDWYKVTHPKVSGWLHSKLVWP